MSASSENVRGSVMQAAGSLVRQVRSALSSSPPAGGRQPASGWLFVTVLCEPSAIDTSALPAPLAELGDRIEVQVRPAPVDKGTELGARLREQPSSGTAVHRLSGTDAQADVRSALRRAKQLLEVGEVLAVDPAPHGERTPTPGGALLEAWTKAAPKGGVA